ncbi:hypothetical protein MLD52_17975 [Puniceicoccaceae bacterium K14]|nr:hypothetical protein [Puniceicoccaceae bacterium K14]
MKITRLEVVSFFAGLAIILVILFRVLEEETEAAINSPQIEIERPEETHAVLLPVHFPRRFTFGSEV